MDDQELGRSAQLWGLESPYFHTYYISIARIFVLGEQYKLNAEDV